jgi:hypothetical protein
MAGIIGDGSGNGSGNGNEDGSGDGSGNWSMETGDSHGNGSGYGTGNRTNRKEIELNILKHIPDRDLPLYIGIWEFDESRKMFEERLTG